MAFKEKKHIEVCVQFGQEEKNREKKKRKGKKKWKEKVKTEIEKKE